MGLWFGRFEWTRTLQLIDRMLKIEKKTLVVPFYFLSRDH